EAHRNRTHHQVDDHQQAASGTHAPRVPRTVMPAEAKQCVVAISVRHKVDHRSGQRAAGSGQRAAGSGQRAAGRGQRDNAVA
ncbi:hypothetical protein, partial [Rhodococcus sp. RS1C4]